MGWWWSSNTSSASESKLVSETSQSAMPPLTTTPPPTTQPISSSQSSDEAEFHAAFPHLAPSTEPAPSPTSDDHSTSQEMRTSSQSEYPTEMSCRAAFDSAFYCTSFGGKFNDIYRYGELRSCSEHWSDFWFCMRIKSKGKGVKELLVEERYREKEDKLRQGRNSEEVWDRRREGEKILGAFAKAEEEYRRVEGQ